LGFIEFLCEQLTPTQLGFIEFFVNNWHQPNWVFPLQRLTPTQLGFYFAKNWDQPNWVSFL
jgi:hypothetical protein